MQQMLLQDECFLLLVALLVARLLELSKQQTLPPFVLRDLLTLLPQKRNVPQVLRGKRHQQFEKQQAFLLEEQQEQHGKQDREHQHLLLPRVQLHSV